MRSVPAPAEPYVWTDGEPRAAYVALGSNQGDRLAHLRGAVRGLSAHPHIRRVDPSPVYETKAHMLQPQAWQPDYLNAVVRLQTTLVPEALLAFCQVLERRAGRDRAREGRWGARPLDLDLLAYDRETRWTTGLTLPHPRLGQRRFVLQPLADLAPHLYLPEPYEATVAELLERCGDPDVAVRQPFELA